MNKIKVLICPDKFKFSMTAADISKTILRFIPKHYQCKSIQLADGGEGSLETISKQMPGSWIKCQVLDPLFRNIQSKYLIGQNKQSYIQMSRASGLQLLSLGQRNPLHTTTYGTGQLILDSLNRGHSTINLLIGGSATNDGGIGVANALGYEFLDRHGEKLQPIGQNLININSIKHRDPKIKELIQSSSINVFTDVKNTFTGLHGAAKVYAPQKGATPAIVDQLQTGMINLKQIFLRNYGIDVDKISGSGAAGGLGGGCSIFLNSGLHSGIELIFEVTNFDKLLKECDLVITGEGKVDHQTLQGKVVKGVIDRARKYRKRVLVLCAYCQNVSQFVGLQNVELVELLKKDERQIINPGLTKVRLQDFMKSYQW